MTRVFAVAGRAFRTQRWPVIVAALAFALTLPMLGAGYMLDDHLHVYVLDGNRFPGGPRGVWDLYHFSDGGEGTRGAMEQGLYPWWSNPELRLAFFRPITSMWRAADHALFGHVAWPAHLGACLLWAAVALTAARMYRRFIGGAAAGLAALLYAIDDAHSLSVVWIANRHALVSTALGLIALSIHVGRRSPDRPSWASGGLLLLAMLGGESALGVMGYVVAYEVLGRSAAWKERARAIAPHFAALAVWAVCYRLGGYGAGGNAFYVDPIRQPGAFAVAIVERSPKLLAGQLLLPPAELWAMASPGARLVPFVGALFIALAIAGLVLRGARRHPATPWLALGTLLSIVPVTATLPDDRLLLLPGFGAMGLVAIALGHAARRWKAGELGIIARAALVGFATIHLVLAPVLLPLRAVSIASMFGSFTARAAKTLPEPRVVAGRDLIVLVSVDAFLTAVCFLERYYVGSNPEGRPRRMRTLTVQQAGVGTVERDGERAFIIRASHPMFDDPLSRVYYEGTFQAGEERVVGDMTARVLEVDELGLPMAVRFELEEPLETKTFVVFENGAFHEVTLPLPGDRLEVETDSFIAAMQP